MPIPSEEELNKFREELEQLDVESVKEKLRHQLFGAKDSWKTKEAMARVKKVESAGEYKIKHDSLVLQSEGNDIARHANTIAKVAILISIAALAVSIYVALYK